MEWGAAACGAPGVFREAPSRPVLGVSDLSQQAPRLRSQSWSSRVSLPGGKETRGGTAGPRARASWALHSLCARLSARVLLDDQEIGVSSFRDSETPSEGLSPWPSLACKPVLLLTPCRGIFQTHSYTYTYSYTYTLAESLGPQPAAPRQLPGSSTCSPSVSAPPLGGGGSPASPDPACRHLSVPERRSE